MGVERNRPSRLVRQAAFDIANLPTSGNNTLTVKLEGLPARGIIHRVTVNYILEGSGSGQQPPFPAISPSIDGLFIHRLGSVAESSPGAGDFGKNTMTQTHAKSIVQAYCLDWLGSGLGGSGILFEVDTTGVPTPANNKSLRSVICSSVFTGQGPAVNVGVQPVAYDTYGSDAGVAPTDPVLGPNSTEGTLFVTILSGGVNFTAYINNSCWVEVEIEPCF